jgi:hypothetical protein
LKVLPFPMEPRLGLVTDNEAAEKRC